MNYLIAVVADRIKAEEAYCALEKEGLPTEKITIVGNGYKTADEFGFIDPSQQARKQARFMAFWLIPFGFVSGFAFNSITHFELFPAAGVVGNHIIGGLLGAVAGAMGSFVVGGVTGLSTGSGDALPYRNRLKQGKYLVIVNGPANLTNQAARILKQFNPETLQNYIEPGNA